MRIALLCNRDVHACLALNLLHQALGDRLVAVYTSGKVGGKAAPSRTMEPLGFVEQDLFERFVWPAAATRPVQGRLLGFDEFPTVYGLPVQRIDSARTPDGLNTLRAADADLFLSVRFGHILGAESIAIPRRGVLNLHSGLLPAYRGVIATFRALANGDAEYGCTLHTIDSPAIDAGGIIARVTRPVDRSRSLLAHIVGLYEPGIAAMANAALSIERGEQLKLEPQDPSSGAYYSFPTDDDVASFTANGWRLFGKDDVAEMAARWLG